jgi:hypothetical protein
MKQQKNLTASDLISNREDASLFQNAAQQAHDQRLPSNEMDKLIDQVSREIYEEQKGEQDLE